MPRECATAKTEGPELFLMRRYGKSAPAQNELRLAAQRVLDGQAQAAAPPPPPPRARGPERVRDALARAGPAVMAEVDARLGAPAADAPPLARLLFLVVDGLPHEAIWRRWMADAEARAGCRVRALVHAHHPAPARRGSRWVGAKARRRRFDTRWGSVELRARDGRASSTRRSRASPRARTRGSRSSRTRACRARRSPTRRARAVAGRRRRRRAGDDDADAASAGAAPTPTPRAPASPPTTTPTPTPRAPTPTPPRHRLRPRAATRP